MVVFLRKSGHLFLELNVVFYKYIKWFFIVWLKQTILPNIYPSGFAGSSRNLPSPKELGKSQR
jgi:hypothetical protein